MSSEISIDESFTAPDIAALKGLVQGKRFWLLSIFFPPQPILSMRKMDDSTAQITTGWVWGPLCGCGKYLIAKQVDGAWTVVSSTWWKS